MSRAIRTPAALGIGLLLLGAGYFGIAGAQAHNRPANTSGYLAQSDSSKIGSPASEDKIVFTYPKPNNGVDPSANTNIWIMNADGSSRTRLTSFTGLDRQPAISPDGSKVVYISYQGGRDTLWVMNSDGTSPTQLPVSGNTGGIAWSPDGTKLAFGNDSGEWWEVWVIDANGSNLRRLTTHGPPAGHPTWSPDGQRIVYAVGVALESFDLYTVNADGTGQSLLVSSASGFSNHYAAWSPDGTKIATVHWPAGSAGPYSLWLMNSDGSGGAAIASSIESPDQNITWSSDGNWLVFGKDGQTWRVRRDGTNLTQITTTGSWEPAASVSAFASGPRGSAIAFVRPKPALDASANTDIWIMDADGSNQTRLTTYNGEDRWPVLSPDGSRIAYTSFREGRHTLWVMNSDGSAAAQLPVGGSTQKPAWSPDGSQIAFTNDSVDWWEIWVINADGSNLRRLTTHGSAAGFPSWSPDGQKLAYAVEQPAPKYYDLYTVNSDGTGPTLLVSASTTGFSNHYAAWSPDGTKIAVLHWPAGGYGPRDLWLMNADGSGGSMLVADVERDIQNLSWAADGNEIVFSKSDQVWRVRRDGTNLTQITTTGGWEPSASVSAFASGPRGLAIAFARPQPETGANSEIWIMDADGSNQTQLTAYGNDDRQPALSPDGSKIAYISLQGGRYTLWVMNSDGTNPEQLPVAGSSTIPAWSPDGSRIAFQNDSDHWQEVWIINANGTNLRRITTHAEAAGSPSWSPDGTKLVYLSEPIARYHNLYTINADGTGQTLLVSASGTGFSNHRPAWSPDGTQIATIHYPAGMAGVYDLWVMNADGTSGSVIVSNIDPDNLNRLSWSPDGNWIVFSKGGQIWRVRKDGTQLTQIISNNGWEPSVGSSPTACTPQANESDILLVVDRSGSMADNNKLVDAKVAVTTFANLTSAPPDQLGLVSFSTSATLDQGLTTNKAAVISATQALAAAGSTRIDLALLQARLELTSTRHITSHAKIIILLTDGLQSQTGNDPVLAEAAAAKAEGATIFTIGLGPDADASLLQQVATSPAHYFFAPTGAQLQAIYQQISEAINCLDIGGRTYIDQDSNGVYTPGTDTPLPNIRIRLAGPLTRTTTSQATGAYLFANNFPGVYTLTLDLTSVPPAYQPISPTTRVISLAVRDELDNHFGFRFQTEDGVIVFTRPLPAGGTVNSDVWIMDADGANQTQLTNYDQEDRMPALSPDSSKVAYVSYRGSRYTLWVMNSDGTNPTQLPVGGNTNRIAWSWDGSRLAITNDSEDWWEIWTIDADGSNLKRLTTYGPPIGNPSWSPNGWKIVYTANPGWMVSDIYTMNSDGTGQSLLVSASSTGYSNHMPAWSPDGTKIATVRWPAGGAGPFDLWLMNADGSGGSVLVQNVDDPHLNRISWTPDGAWIVFAKNGQVWRVKPGGSLPTQLTAAGGWEPLARPRFTVAAPIRRIYLPAIARNYCSGPIVDDFSNPGSGWPINETSYWSYSYLSGEYRMYAKTSAFAGVSRGDRLAGQYTVEIDARRASEIDGSLGILLGIADDWSEFYTFEVFPDLQIGAIFHNLNGRWTLVNYASTGAILPGQFTNHLRVETSTTAGHYTYFYINGAYITSLAIPYAPNVSRRVGLTASADDAGFDARFDNYKVVPEGCPASFITSQSSMPEVRPFHEASREAGRIP